MLHSFLIGSEEGGMEDEMNLPLRWDVKTEGHLGDNFFNLERTCPFHLELFGAVHMKVGRFQPDLVFHLPRGELRGYLFLHLLLGNFVGGLGVIMGSG